ncbi:MAG: aspartate 1-decarboxylase [Ignavibacteriaceae bacterium]|jgi:aspartate 1-decarboxylase|nr:aspartate 1-decarboxylase [Ignavibacteriaceae bacterium]NUM71098.1 aspartate 1-decarboxylase [Ignavibacteriaceae bacterium]
MIREMCKSKIQRPVITKAELYYEGSITIDKVLLDAANILPYEKVQVVNVNNGSRLETYTIEGEPNSGVICLNGPAARLGYPGDEIVIISYAQMNDEEIKDYKPLVVIVDKENKIKKML